MSDNSQKYFSKIVKIEISKDKMKAFLLVQKPDSKQAASITAQDINSIIDEEGVKFGINGEIIQKIIDEKLWGKRFLMAEGKNHIPGEDAKLEFSFPTEKSLKPKIGKDGHVDYKAIEVVHSVEKDTVLVRKTPVKLGTNGMDVLGNEIPPMDSIDIELQPGQGTYRDKKDSLILRAATNGVVSYNLNNHTVEVHQVYVIQDSVDFSTGNVDVKCSVEIKGDVKEGFYVRTPYDIEVKGVVEDANISCKGNLKVHAGISGEGISIINVGGDIHTGYIYNQTLKCDGSVYVKSIIRNANVESNDEIVVTGARGVIMGGHITATNKISAEFIGNTNYIPTVIEVGVNSNLKEDFLLKEAEKIALEKEMDEYKQRSSLIEKKSLKEAKDIRLDSFKKKWKEYSEQLERLKKETAELKKVYHDSADPFVSVIKTIYPGTLIKIKHATFKVTNELSHVMFRLVDDEINYSNLI